MSLVDMIKSKVSEELAQSGAEKFTNVINLVIVRLQRKGYSDTYIKDHLRLFYFGINNTVDQFMIDKGY